MKSPFNMRMKLKDYPGAIQFYDDLEAKRPLTEQETERRRQLRVRQSTAQGQKKYREANKEKVKKAQADWRAKNVKRCKTYSQQWCADHAQRVSQRAKEWRAANPDKVAAGKRRQLYGRQRDKFLREIASALGCKLYKGRFEPLTQKDRRKPLMLPAPAETLSLDAPLPALRLASTELSNVVELPALNDQDLGNVTAPRKVA